MATRKELTEIRDLLATALNCMEAVVSATNRDTTNDAASAAWRLADAGLLLRRALESEDIECMGVTTATGRGAVLPS